MKTITELVCEYHFGDYQQAGMQRRKATPIDVSPLRTPIDGLCKQRGWLEGILHPVHHDKTILAVTWKVD
jgi:hypothetical protein